MTLEEHHAHSSLKMKAVRHGVFSLTSDLLLDNGVAVGIVEGVSASGDTFDSVTLKVDGEDVELTDVINKYDVIER
jgi:hypothetical protein